MKADFSKFLGPKPGDAPKYVEPKDAKPLQDADPATTCQIRRELAIRQARQYEQERQS